MKIGQINSYTKDFRPCKNKKTSKIYDSKKPSNIHGINFRGFVGTSAYNGLPLTTSFFRDLPTLVKAVKTLEANFPDGGRILDYACSHGEEAVSVYALLNEPHKFQIEACDVDPEVVHKAKKGTFTLMKDHFVSEDILLSDGLTGYEKLAQDRLFSLLEPASDNKKICSSTFDETKSFNLNASVKNYIHYETRDILQIDETDKTTPVTAVLFRNALYHLLNNKMSDYLYWGEDFSSKNVGGHAQCHQILSEILSDKVHSVLDTGGVFVLGTSFQELTYIADESTPDDEKILAKNTPLYKYSKNNLKNVLAICHDADKKIMLEKKLLNIEQNVDKMYFLKEPPIFKALKKDGRFVPVGYSKVEIEDTRYSVPTVWQKIK